MSDHDFGRGAGDDAFSDPSTVFPETPPLPQVSRTDIMLLAVDAELCPFALGRILRILADRSILPFTIAAERYARFQRLEIEVQSPPDRLALSILQDVRRIMAVRSARFDAAAERRLVRPLMAKI